MTRLRKEARRLISLALGLLLLSGCAQSKAPPEADAAPLPQPAALQDASVREAPFSFEGTRFRYGDRSWDLTQRVPAATGILSARAVGDRILVECHCGPKNGAYCVFDPAAGRFEEDRYGNHLIWQGEDLDTAVYDFWSEVRAWDGSVLADYALPEDEFIYSLAFSPDGAQVEVSIVNSDDGGPGRTEVIDLPRG